MAHFDLFIGPLLKREGGLADHPADPGGVTNRGITIRLWRTYAAALLQLEPSAENLRRLTPAQAAILYRRLFWDPLRASEIRAQFVADAIVDCAVNCGPRTAVRMAQKQLPVAIDGRLGPRTLSAINHANSDKLAALYAAARVDYYRYLVWRRRSLRVFLRGWEKRAFECLPPRLHARARDHIGISAPPLSA